MKAIDLKKILKVKTKIAIDLNTEMLDGRRERKKNGKWSVSDQDRRGLCYFIT